MSSRRGGGSAVLTAKAGTGVVVLQDLRPKLTRRHAMMSPDDNALGGTPDYIRVGADLRATRERLGWSLVDVAANLRIRYAYLAALEEGRIADLPALTYAVGFVRAYAKLLGLDPDEMSRRLRAEIGSEPRTELEFPAPVPDRGVPAGVVVLLGAVLAIGAYIGWYRMSGDRPGVTPVQTAPDRVATVGDSVAQPTSKPTEKAEPAPAAPVRSSTAPVSSPSISPTQAAAAVSPPPAPAGGSEASAVKPASLPPAANSETAHFVLRARGDAWVQVRDRQGQVLLNRVMRNGETWQVPPAPAGQHLLLTTGNAGGTEILVDGVPAPPIGPLGVVKRDFPLDPAVLHAGKPQPQVATTAKPPAAHPQQSTPQ